VIVLDASVVVDLLLALPPHAQAISARVRAEAPRLAAPHLLDAEVGQVLRRFVRAGHLDVARAGGAIDDLAALPIVRYPHTQLLSRAFELRDNATIYDGLYLALAEGLGCALLTRDAAIAGLPGARARVEVLA
jgi:predicted nucleic acid-binding protein